MNIFTFGCLTYHISMICYSMCNFQGTIEWVWRSTKTRWKFIFISVFARTGIGIYAVSEGTQFLSFTHSLFNSGDFSPNGDNEIRTRDPLLARQVLSQLSYTPILGLSGLEPPTSRLSGVRSNRLSYKPICFGSHLLSHAVSSIVSSAAKVLTIVFGMRTGVSPKRIATKRLRYSICVLPE